MLTYSNFLKVSAPGVSLFSVFAQACDNRLALDLILNPNQKTIQSLQFAQNTNPTHLALDLLLLGIAMASAIPNGLTVFYHMVKKSDNAIQNHQSENSCLARSCQIMRKALSFLITSIGVLLRTGLTIKSSQDFLKKVIFPYFGHSITDFAKQSILWTISIPVSVIGSGFGSLFTEGEHIHRNINHLSGNQHQHQDIINNEDEHQETPRQQCVINTLTYTVYVISFISHTVSYIFAAKEITDEIPNKSQLAQYLLYGFGLLLCAIAAIGDSFLEGDHAHDAAKYIVNDFSKEFSCKISDGLGIPLAFINMFAHIIPEFAGVVILLKTFNVEDMYCWIIAGFVAGSDMFPNLAVDGRYIIATCRELASYFCCEKQQKPSTDREIQNSNTESRPDERTPLTLGV